MHRVKMFAAVGVAVALLAAACSDDNNPTQPPPRQQEVFKTALSGQNERPAVTTTATGNAQVTLDTTATTLTYTVTFSGLADSAIAAHIHGPYDPANPPTSGTAPVVLGFTSVPRDKSGTITGTAAKSTATLGNNVSWDSLVVLLRTGHAYVNVHSKTYPGGEIRGQLDEHNH